MAKKINGKVASEKKITLENHPGREVEIEGPGNILIRVRVFLVKQRLYQVMALGAKEFVRSKDVDNYLDSFKLSK